MVDQVTMDQCGGSFSGVLKGGVSYFSWYSASLLCVWTIALPSTLQTNKVLVSCVSNPVVVKVTHIG